MNHYIIKSTFFDRFLWNLYFWAVIWTMEIWNIVQKGKYVPWALSSCFSQRPSFRDRWPSDLPRPSTLGSWGSVQATICRLEHQEWRTTHQPAMRCQSCSFPAICLRFSIALSIFRCKVDALFWPLCGDNRCKSHGRRAWASRYVSAADRVVSRRGRTVGRSQPTLYCSVFEDLLES